MAKEVKNKKVDIKCCNENCDKIIGYSFYGKNRFYAGTWQIGFKSACCRKHLFTNN